VGSIEGQRPVDLAVVGAGIVGLAHAVLAVENGMSVAVIDRDDRPAGASVRNFGHGYVSAQAGAALEYALRARTRWLELSREAGFWARETGTLLVARWPEELDVIREFAANTPVRATVLPPADVSLRLGIGAEGVLGALWTPLDVRVDPRSAAPALAAWLARRPGATVHWGTAVLGVGTGVVETARGEIAAGTVVVAAGHDVDHLLPGVAEAGGVTRCALQMLRVAAPGVAPVEPALATGLALLRYSGFGACPSLAALRARYAYERPELLEHGVNLLLTQQPDGTFILGDTHRYAHTPDAFRAEALDELVLGEASRLLETERLEVLERWLGVYAWSGEGEFLVATPETGVHVVSVTSGIGMTTAFGLAERVFHQLLNPVPAVA
jgi:FAD dependent oxidoreductase TIGR03364